MFQGARQMGIVVKLKQRQMNQHLYHVDGMFGWGFGNASPLNPVIGVIIGIEVLKLHSFIPHTGNKLMSLGKLFSKSESPLPTVTTAVTSDLKDDRTLA